MPRRSVSATAVSAALIALAAAAPSFASADATIATGRTCYYDTGSAPQGKFAATGFAPGAPLTTTVDGAPGPAVAADATGALADTAFPVPVLPGKTLEKQHTITVTDGTSTATQTFSSTRLWADYSPSTGDPGKLRVSFSVYGMNLVAPDSTVYVHYVTPAGKHKQTVALGTAKGACGHITKTPKRKLFPFKAQSGKWSLQFDTSKAYRPGTNALLYPWAIVGVQVRRVAAGG